MQCLRLAKCQERDIEVQWFNMYQCVTVLWYFFQLTNKTLSNSQAELENRLHQLTETLIQKQTMLEALGTEKSSLVFQLERLEQQLKNAQGGQSGGPAINMSGLEVPGRRGWWRLNHTNEFFIVVEERMIVSLCVSIWNVVFLCFISRGPTEKHSSPLQWTRRSRNVWKSTQGSQHHRPLQVTLSPHLHCSITAPFPCVRYDSWWLPLQHQTWDLLEALPYGQSFRYPVHGECFKSYFSFFFNF